MNFYWLVLGVFAALLSGKFAPPGFDFTLTKEELLTKGNLGAPFNKEVKDFFEGKGSGAFVASSNQVCLFLSCLQSYARGTLLRPEHTFLLAAYVGVESAAASFPRASSVAVLHF